MIHIRFSCQGKNGMQVIPEDLVGTAAQEPMTRENT